MKENPNKWIYDPNNITTLNAGLDSICSKLEDLDVVTDKEIGLIRSAINALYAMSEQQQHLAVGIEKLKLKLEK